MKLNSPLSALVLFLAIAVVPILSGCDSTGAGPEDDPPLETVRVEDLAAGGEVDTSGGQPEQVKAYTFYSLREQRVVEDSASADWDIAFQGTTILVNGGTSGPGQGAGYVAEAALSEVKEVNADQLKVDDAEAGLFVVPPGSDNGWYHYNPEIHLITPIPGRTIVVHSADGGAYAKLRILSYYRGAPSQPDSQQDASRYYTFEYVLQDDGSISFE